MLSDEEVATRITAYPAHIPGETTDAWIRRWVKCVRDAAHGNCIERETPRCAAHGNPLYSCPICPVP